MSLCERTCARLMISTLFALARCRVRNYIFYHYALGLYERAQLLSRGLVNQGILRQLHHLFFIRLNLTKICFFSIDFSVKIKAISQYISMSASNILL